MTKQFIVGEVNAPQIGSTIFQADFLGECYVNFLIVDRQVWTQTSDTTPDFLHKYSTNKIVLQGGKTFTNGSEIIIDITPLKF